MATLDVAQQLNRSEWTGLNILASYSFLVEEHFTVGQQEHKICSTVFTVRQQDHEICVAFYCYITGA